MARVPTPEEIGRLRAIIDRRERLAFHLAMVRSRVLSGQTVSLEIRASVVDPSPSVYVSERDLRGIEVTSEGGL